MQNTTIRIWAKVVIVGVTGALMSGCLVMGSKHEVLRKDETVKKIEFESEEAGILFHKVRRQATAHGGQEEHDCIVIPFIIAHNTHRKLSDNARYNDEISKCDANGDGHITLIEAKIYGRDDDKCRLGNTGSCR